MVCCLGRHRTICVCIQSNSGWVRRKITFSSSFVILFIMSLNLWHSIIRYTGRTKKFPQLTLKSNSLDIFYGNYSCSMFGNFRWRLVLTYLQLWRTNQRIIITNKGSMHTYIYIKMLLTISINNNIIITYI